MTPSEQKLQAQVEAQEKTILRQNVEIAQRDTRIANLERIKAQLERAIERLTDQRARAERYFDG